MYNDKGGDLDSRNKRKGGASALASPGPSRTGATTRDASLSAHRTCVCVCTSVCVSLAHSTNPGNSLLPIMTENRLNCNLLGEKNQEFHDPQPVFRIFGCFGLGWEIDPSVAKSINYRQSRGLVYSHQRSWWFTSLNNLPDRLGPFGADQLFVQAAVEVGQAVGVHAHLVQDGGVQAADVEAILDGGAAQLVGRADATGVAGFKYLGYSNQNAKHVYTRPEHHRCNRNVLARSGEKACF